MTPTTSTGLPSSKVGANLELHAAFRAEARSSGWPDIGSAENITPLVSIVT